MSCASVQELSPRANRLHIGIFGRRNAGKSSLMNALTGQNAALVSQTPGSTTDPVYKAMELHPLGPVVFVDTAGLDDTEDDLGRLRIEKSREIFDKADIALLMIPAGAQNIDQEIQWYDSLKKNEIVLLILLSRADELSPEELERQKARLEQQFAQEIFPISSITKGGIEYMRNSLCQRAKGLEEPPIVTHLLPEEALVLLVMPQDKQAPKGRLILPQVQVLRELLDARCHAICTTLENLPLALSRLGEKPHLVITDSQVFHAVNQILPCDQALTSFSVLMAARKGEFAYYFNSAQKIDSLKDNDHILIVEACTHVALKNDIGREQIPGALRKKTGLNLEIDIHVGADLPKNIQDYQLVIQCGSCMITRRQNMNRLRKMKEMGLAVTNYGLALAKLSGMLDRISTPLNMPQFK